jgi:hypothetical protein
MTTVMNNNTMIKKRLRLGATRIAGATVLADDMGLPRSYVY